MIAYFYFFFVLAGTAFIFCFYSRYDLSIGTSERGKHIEHVTFTAHQHVLVVFGGLAGIEAALEADDVLTVDDPALLFDYYLNTCPDQGSRTIRTEEAILITLAELRTRLQPKVCGIALTYTMVFFCIVYFCNFHQLDILGFVKGQRRSRGP